MQGAALPRPAFSHSAYRARLGCRALHHFSCLAHLPYTPAATSIVSSPLRRLHHLILLRLKTYLSPGKARPLVLRHLAPIFLLTAPTRLSCRFRRVPSPRKTRPPGQSILETEPRVQTSTDEANQGSVDSSQNNRAPLHADKNTETEKYER